MPLKNYHGGRGASCPGCQVSKRTTQDYFLAPDHVSTGLADYGKRPPRLENSRRREGAHARPRGRHFANQGP